MKFITNEIPLLNEIETAIVDEITLQEIDNEKHWTASVFLADNPTVKYTKIPIQTATIPRIKQRVKMSKLDEPGGEVPYTITSLVFDEKFPPPQEKNFVAGSGDDAFKFEPGDTLLHTDKGIILIKADADKTILIKKGEINIGGDGEQFASLGEGVDGNIRDLTQHVNDIRAAFTAGIPAAGDGGAAFKSSTLAAWPVAVNLDDMLSGDVKIK